MSFLELILLLSYDGRYWDITQKERIIHEVPIPSYEIDITKKFYLVMFAVCIVWQNPIEQRI